MEEYATKEEFFNWLWEQWFNESERDDAIADFEEYTGKHTEPGFNTL